MEASLLEAAEVGEATLPQQSQETLCSPSADIRDQVVPAEEALQKVTVNITMHACIAAYIARGPTPKITVNSRTKIAVAVLLALYPDRFVL